MRELKSVLFCIDIFVNTEYRVAHWGSVLSPGTEEHLSIPVRLSKNAGFVRDWCARVVGLQTTVCARPVNNGELPLSINGVLLAIYDDDDELERRAYGNGFKIPIEHFESLGWQPLPDVSFVHMFVPYLLEPVDLHNPILQTSLDTCLKGFLEYGQEFAVEFLETTIGWSKFWINDREVSRRPWIHEPRYKHLDDLLERRPSSGNTFSERKLEVEYTRYFAQKELNTLQEDVRETDLQILEFSGKLNTQPEHFIFGYGSLINSISRYQTNPDSKDAIPVRVAAEFRHARYWNYHGTSSRLTALGVRQIRDEENGQEINGVIYPILDSDMAQVDEREEGYRRVALPWEFVTPLSWAAPPAHTKTRLWIYVPERPEPPSADFPILQTYIDVCLDGCLEHGEDFAETFLKTTFGWNRYWLNDRVLARRPWIHCPNYAVIDRLLEKFPVENNALQHRKLGVEFGVLFTREEQDKENPL